MYQIGLAISDIPHHVQRYAHTEEPAAPLSSQPSAGTPVHDSSRRRGCVDLMGPVLAVVQRGPGFRAHAESWTA